MRNMTVHCRLSWDHIWITQLIFIAIKFCLDYTSSVEILTPCPNRKKVKLDKNKNNKQTKAAPNVKPIWFYKELVLCSLT